MRKKKRIRRLDPPTYDRPPARKKEFFNEKQQAEVLKLIALGQTITAAAREVGVDPALIYWAARKDEKFAPAYEEAIAQGVIRVEEELHRHCFEVRPGDVKAIQLYLQARAPQTWRKTVNQEVSGRNGGPIVIETQRRQKLITEILEMVKS